MNHSVQKILLIEDNSGDAGLISDMAADSEGNYEIRIADRLSTGLKILGEEAADLVLLDLYLPDSSGIDTLRKLHTKKPELPVVVLTGLPDENLAIEAIGLGAQDYLVKGRFDGLLLTRSIRYAIERKRTEAALRENEERFRAAFENAASGRVLTGTDGRFIQVNRFFRDMLGYSEREILSRDFLSVTHPDDVAAGKEAVRVLMSGEKEIYRSEKRYIHKDGRTVWALVNTFLFRDPANTPLYFITDIQDITDLRSAVEALQYSESRFRGIASAVIDAFILIDNDGLVSFWNEAATRIFGYTAAEITGKYLHSFIMPERYIDSFRKGFEAFRLTGEGPFVGKTYEVEGVRKDGAEFPAELSLSSLKLKGKWNAIGIVRDITGRKKLEEEIRHMADHDPLTDLPNRRLLKEIAAVELAQARRNGSKLAILFLDLDRFKEINDTLGHEIGDELLKQVATRLRSHVRRSDTIARTGGDEFNMILADLARAEDMADIAAKIVQSFRKPFFLGPHEFLMTTSIGISVYPDDGEDIDTLLRYADIAMYYAKEYGRDNYQFYNPAINIRSLERMKLESSLRRTVERGELIMHYQPLIEISSGRIVCAEALARWRHPEMGLLEPERFIPLAEESGFISVIDEWALRKVCVQIREWTESGFRPPCVTVNISARQFQSSELVDKVAQVLKDTGISPDLLEIEITESTAMKNVERTVRRLQELTKMGVRIQIDDFGTGYSSLSYLKRFPIRKLKIDQSFIRDIATDPDDRAIISAVTSMARKMSIRTVAEGVETEEQLSFLRASECDEAQGFLFNRPLPPEEFRELLVTGKR